LFFSVDPPETSAVLTPATEVEEVEDNPASRQKDKKKTQKTQKPFFRPRGL
jgi:hypothetical protein